MIYDPSSSADERRRIFGLPPAPDEAYAAEWDSIEMSSQLVHLASPYDSDKHPSSKLQGATRSLVGSRSLATELLDKQESERVAIDRERAKRNGEQFQEAPPITYDKVLLGPEWLYREPRIANKAPHFTKHSHLIANSRSDRPSMMHGGASAHFVADDITRAKRECREALKRMVDAARAVEEARGEKPKPFFDSSFFVGSRAALYPEGTAPSAFTQEPCDVERLSVMFPDALFQDPDPIPYTIVSTTSRTNHFTSAVEAIRRSPLAQHSVTQLFVCPEEGVHPQDFVFERGMIGVLLFVDGRWDWVIIDDLVATDKRKRPLFIATVPWNKVTELEDHFGCGHSAANAKVELTWEPIPAVELWPFLLHKAVAKRLGSFDALDGGIPREMLSMLTGYSEGQEVAIACEDDAEAAILALSDDAALLLLYPKPLKERIATSVASSEKEQRAPWGKQQLDEETSFPLGDLPCVVQEVDWDALVAQVYCPWGTMRRGSVVDCTLPFSMSQLTRYFRRADVCRRPNASYPMIEFHSVSDPEHPSWFALSLSTAICTNIGISVEQGDPKASLHLPHRIRKSLPYCVVSWSLFPKTSGAMVRKLDPMFCSPEMAVRQVACNVDLHPGDYWLMVRLTGGPAVPIRISLTAPGTAFLTLSLKDTDPEVHGISTKLLQGALAPAEVSATGGSIADPEKLLSAVMSRRASRLLGRPLVPANVHSVFEDSDFLRKGVLSEDGVHRAFFAFIKAHTTAGDTLRDELLKALKDNPEGVDVNRFNEILLACLSSGFHTK